MKAVILCAGMGTRLGHLTENCPKVMLPINGRPLLEHHIDWLIRYGVRDFYVNLHYLPNVITDYFRDGARFNVRIAYSFEEDLQGTAGALKGFWDELSETFLVHYGDVYSELDVSEMLRFHRRMKAVATLVVHPTDRPHDSDVVVLNEDAKVTSVHHRPGVSQYGNLGNAGCYLLEPSVLRYIPDQETQCDFIEQVFPRMIASGEALYGYRTGEFLHDMGTFDRYEKLKRAV